MKQKSIIIAIYAALILIGGIIGYVVAGSIMSIIMATLFSVVLFGCSLLVWHGNTMAYTIATSLVFSLLLFFGYRYYLTSKIAPAGIMALISVFLFAYLAITREEAIKE